jgi:superfamily I DNA/RNA helicase
MVTEDDVDAESILVLCFTNAAVDEIKSRLNEYVKSGGHRALKNVDVRTFHSFSWWLISQANEIFLEQGWGKTALQNLNYETSLSCASEIIRRFSDDIVENWGHFIVDEVQDLTNSLARFVLYIINACLEKNCGITVLGDSCQAIYDYTQENTISPLISTDFYKCLYRKLYGKAKFFKLEINHRQTSELLQITKLFRQSIIEQNLRNMADEVYNLNESITELKNDLLTIGEQELNRIRNRGKICLMCRNNGQTLRLSSTLRKRQIPHVLNTHETKDNYTPWISKIFFEYPHTNISFDNFKILYEHVKTSVDNCAAEEIWDKFQTLMNTDNENLVISELLQAIKISKIDDPVLRLNSRGAIIVSNIHRSKGREYECVIVDKSFINSLIDEEKNIGEYKTLYVAVTRPKKRLYSASLSKPGDLRSITIYDSKRKRWGKARGKRIIYFEIKSDIDIDVNSYLTVNSGQAQQYLDNVHEGDPIILKRNIRNGKVNYDVIHCLNDTETTIGRIKSSYVDDLYSYIRPEKAVNMPAFIDELYVSSVYTHIADDETLRLYPELKKLAPNKVWRWVEFVGLGHANYDTY